MNNINMNGGGNNNNSTNGPTLVNENNSAHNHQMSYNVKDYNHVEVSFNKNHLSNNNSMNPTNSMYFNSQVPLPPYAQQPPPLPSHQQPISMNMTQGALINSQPVLYYPQWNGFLVCHPPNAPLNGILTNNNNSDINTNGSGGGGGGGVKNHSGTGNKVQNHMDKMNNNLTTGESIQKHIQYVPNGNFISNDMTATNNVNGISVASTSFNSQPHSSTIIDNMNRAIHEPLSDEQKMFFNNHHQISRMSASADHQIPENNSQATNNGHMMNTATTNLGQFQNQSHLMYNSIANVSRFQPFIPYHMSNGGNHSNLYSVSEQLSLMQSFNQPTFSDISLINNDHHSGTSTTNTNEHQSTNKHMSNLVANAKSQSYFPHSPTYIPSQLPSQQYIHHHQHHQQQQYQIYSNYVLNEQPVTSAKYPNNNHNNVPQQNIQHHTTNSSHTNNSYSNNYNYNNHYYDNRNSNGYRPKSSGIRRNNDLNRRVTNRINKFNNIPDEQPLPPRQEPPPLCSTEQSYKELFPVFTSEEPGKRAKTSKRRETFSGIKSEKNSSRSFSESVANDKVEKIEVVEKDVEEMKIEETKAEEVKIIETNSTDDKMKEDDSLELPIEETKNGEEEKENDDEIIDNSIPSEENNEEIKNHEIIIEDSPNIQIVKEEIVIERKLSENYEDEQPSSSPLMSIDNQTDQSRVDDIIINGLNSNIENIDITPVTINDSNSIDRGVWSKIKDWNSAFQTPTTLDSHQPTSTLSVNSNRISKTKNDKSSSKMLTLNDKTIKFNNLLNKLNDQISNGRKELIQSDGSFRCLGLPNQRQLCFVNAVLQSIFSVNQFFAFLVNIFHTINDLSLINHRYRISEFPLKLLFTFSQFAYGVKDKGNERELNQIIRQLHEIIAKKLPSLFEFKSQQDAQECLILIVTALNEELVWIQNECEKLNEEKTSKKRLESNISINSDEDADEFGEWKTIGRRGRPFNERKVVVERTILTDIFFGLLASSVKSTEQSSNGPAINIEPFLMLPLNLPTISTSASNKDLISLFNQFTEIETIEEENKKVIYSKQTKFYELPKILILHMKLYSFDNNVSQKICQSINPPSTFVFPQNLISEESFIARQEINRTYDLLSIIHHEGEKTVLGHYVADAYRKQKNAWFRFNDEQFSELKKGKELNVTDLNLNGKAEKKSSLKQNRHSNKRQSKQLTPYLIFYERRD
ncbi:hypothetical protein SNEBB_004769 [Seison nebaliae]|nr:hypothetical protein SNEBB_004769 [Seison nebaliae]